MHLHFTLPFDLESPGEELGVGLELSTLTGDGEGSLHPIRVGVARTLVGVRRGLSWFLGKAAERSLLNE